MLDFFTLYLNHPDYGWGFSILSWTPNDEKSETSHFIGICFHDGKIEGEILWNGFGILIDKSIKL